MPVVVVAGGLGDLGRLITDALVDTGKHEVYVLSRKGIKEPSLRVCPLKSLPYNPILQTDYSPASLAHHLSSKHVGVVISALIMDTEAACESQLRLVRAAESCPSVTRFVPSEFNVEYDVGGEVLPYAEKRFHMACRRELEGTRTLEYTWFYPGMLMDYFVPPPASSSSPCTGTGMTSGVNGKGGGGGGGAIRPLCFFIDAESGMAVLPDDGEARMSTTLAVDAARYLALSLSLHRWPRVLKVVASTISLNELVGMTEEALGRRLHVRYRPVQDLLLHRHGAGGEAGEAAEFDLPSNVDIAARYGERFPGGLGQVRGLVGDLEAGVALGAYDLDKVAHDEGCLDLVEAFSGEAVVPPRGVEEAIREAWGGQGRRRA